ncbi:hypothetical protein ACM66B_006002 [Microbotryomycetes sp. NB124-2]
MDDAAFLRRAPSTTKRYGASASLKRDRRLSAISDDSSGHVQNALNRGTRTDARDAARTRPGSVTKGARGRKESSKGGFRWSDSSDDEAVDENGTANVGRTTMSKVDGAMTITSTATTDHKSNRSAVDGDEDDSDRQTEWDQQRAMENRPTRRQPRTRDTRQSKTDSDESGSSDDVPPPTPSKRKREANARLADETSRHSPLSRPATPSTTPRASTSANAMSAQPGVVNTQVEAPQESPVKRKRTRAAAPGDLTAPVETAESNNSTFETLARPSTPSAESVRSAETLKSPARDLSRVFESFAVRGKAQAAERAKGAATSMTARLKGKTKAATAADTTEDSQSSVANAKDDTSREETPSAQSPSRTPMQSPRPNSPLPTVLSPGQTVSPVKINARPLSRMSSLNAEAVQLGPRGKAGSKRTYGGSRTLKPDVEEEEILLGTQTQPAAASEASSSAATPGSSGIISKYLPQMPRKPAERRSYSAMREMLGIDQDEEDEQSLEASQLRSVTQLRAKGESSRFVDEFNYLMEGLQKDDTVSGRRAAALEILRRMQDRDFFRKLKSSGFDERVYMQFRRAEAGEGDRILDSALAFLVVLLVRDQRIAEALCRVSSSTFTPSDSQPDIYEQDISDLFSFLRAIVGRDWAAHEIGKSQAKSLSKTEARYLSSLRDIIDQFKLLEPGTLTVSVRSLALLAISILSSFAPRSIFQPQQLICVSGTFGTVVTVFTTECAGLQARFAKYERGLELLPSDGSINLYMIDLCLRVFEATTSATPLAVANLNQHRTSLAQSLVNLILASHVLIVNEEDGRASRKTSTEALDNLLSALRLIIDLTTSDPEWSAALSDVPGIVFVLVKLIVTARTPDKSTVDRFKSLSSSPDQQDAKLPGVDEVDTDAQRQVKEDVKFDILCLALGVLTNLVESVERVQDDLRNTMIDANCRLDRSCTLQCQCRNRTSALDRLTALYLDPLSDSSNELNKSFVNGYAGITLGLVMLDNVQNQDVVLDGLKNESKAKFNLIKALQEFATLHQQQPTAAAGEIGVDEDDRETARKIQRLVDRLKRN